MISEIVHVGVTVSDIERSIAFYRDVLGLEFVGRLKMEGPETDKLFNYEGAVAKVAYLKRGKLDAPPIELIELNRENTKKRDADLFSTSISEICFVSDDLMKDYEDLKAKGVDFISEPQFFDFTPDGFSKSIAVYFRDPDGIIMELMQYL